MPTILRLSSGEEVETYEVLESIMRKIHQHSGNGTLTYSLQDKETGKKVNKVLFMRHIESITEEN